MAVNDLTEQLEKIAIRCTACGRYRRHDEFKTPLTAYDDPRRPICDDCRNPDATKSVIRREPIRIDIELTKLAKLRANLEQVARSQPQNVVKAANPRSKDDRIWAGAMMMAKAWAAQLDENQAKRKSREELVKAELSRRRVAEIEAKTAAMQRRARVAKQARAQAEANLAEVQWQQAELAAQIEKLAHRTDAVLARAEAADADVRRQAEHRAAAAAIREERDRAEWSFKAAQTSHDPILRSVYMARANGEETDDE